MTKNHPDSCGCSSTSKQTKPDGASRGMREDYPAKETPALPEAKTKADSEQQPRKIR